MAVSTKFWDKIAPKYAKRPIENIEAYEAALAQTRTYLGTEKRALEIGCGTGSTALLLANQVSVLTATDISAKMIEIGVGKAEAQNITNVDFMQADVFDNRLVPEFYDVVMAHNVLHLIENLPQAINRISELLKPGGIFISKTPCLGEDSFLLKIMVTAMRAVGKAPYVAFIKGETIEGFLQDEGFQILEKGNYPEKSHNHYFVAKKA